MTNNPEPIALLQDVLSRVRKQGADAADAVMFHSADVQISTRRLKPESIERSESAAVGLRAWVGKKQAVVSSTDTSPKALAELAERVVSMARVSTEDPDSGLAPDALLAAEFPALDLCDGGEPETEWLMQQCRECEESALSVPGITNSEGADAAYGRVTVALATSPAKGKGFARSYQTSHCSVSVSVLAGEGTGMERDYDYASVRHRGDLPPAASIGKSAALRTLKRLNPRKVATSEVPVVFNPRVSRSLLSALAGAISGASVSRGTSFLKSSLNQKVFGDSITIMDDPHRLRGLGSRPFDAEGVAGRRMALVQDGVLTSWLLDVRTASRLKLKTTGHASRGVASVPSPSSSNLYMEAGKKTPKALMEDIKSGFYVTEAYGMGVNLVTGDYSQGASGFWIENGQIAYPVSEVTIASHLKDMFLNLVPANDLEFRYATNAPTIRVARMTVAGA